MYIEGDVINSLGVIEKNHCGLPWLAGQDGLYYGVLQVRLFSNYESVYIDAVSGKILSQDEINERLNNEKFNYENKGSDEWYSKNRERIKKNRLFRLRHETWQEKIKRLLFKHY